MRLDNIEIINYRNLDGVKISFSSEINFIVGENNLGKTNFLDLLNVIFNRNNFNEDDFSNSLFPIKIHFSLILSDIEQGLFDDLFDPNDNCRVNIIATQESAEDNIEFQHKESGNTIRSSIVKSVNYINYSSLRNPATELNFDKNKGVGKFLNYIIVKLLKTDVIKDIDFVESEKFDSLLITINQQLRKIRPFRDFSIQAVKEDNPENLLSRLMILVDREQRTLDKLGYGVQFLSIITLSIFERLLNLSKQKLNRSIVEDSLTSEKCISVLIGLDEPEIHLHPYAQRALVKYLKEIGNNRDSDFIGLLKSILEIDKLLGQIIIVSHSPNILLDNYKQIIRFCRDDNKVLVVKSGVNIVLDQRTEKQLLKNLPYIKEAFFSKVIILVEGDSELGALPIFSERLKVNLDELGISVVQAASGDSIPPLMELLDEFAIYNLGVMDSDKRTGYGNRLNLYFTQGIDFEDEIYNSFDILDYITYLEEEFLGEGKVDFFIGKARRLNFPINPRQPIVPQLNSTDQVNLDLLKTESEQEVLQDLRNRKSILTGRDLAIHVTAIPQVYQQIILEAKRISEQC